jgi:diacylglycerol O-acyltransferase
MSDRLSPLDAAFLEIEDEDRRASMAIASVAILEGPAPSHEEFMTALSARLPLVDRYRQKLRRVPLDLGNPSWVDDPHFDIAHHVRRTCLPSPGDDEALCQLMGRVMSQRLDRDRPLWEYWVVEGLAGNRWALISKVHHCMVDGVSGTNLYHVLFDESASPERTLPVDTWSPAPEPSTLALTAQALTALALSPIDQIRLAIAALRAPADTLARAVGTIRGLAVLAGALKPATATSLVGPIGRQRRYAIARASLADVVNVGRQAGVTVNDVVLAAITGGFRAVLSKRGEDPQAHSVRSLVPVSVRALGEEGIYENRLSLMLAFLPVHLADPVERLSAVHTHLAELKASSEANAAAAMTTLATHEPFAPISWGVRLAARLPQRTIVTVTTNVPGPRKPLYLLGRKAVEILPYVPIAIRLRSGISVFTYCDELTFGVTGDFEYMPEVDLMASAIAQGLQELVDLYPPRPQTQPQTQKRQAVRRRAAAPKKATGKAPKPRGGSVASRTDVRS